jgi:hypothetical protein
MGRLVDETCLPEYEGRFPDRRCAERQGNQYEFSRFFLVSFVLTSATWEDCF